MILLMCLVAAAAFAVTWHFVKPAPPDHVVIATGSKTGAYYAMALKYAEYFAANGITLEVRETAGSAENYKLLTQPGGDVEIAIVQGGTSPPAEQRPHVQAVASIYYEPVMVFYRGDTPMTTLPQLAGKKISIGVEGSGTQVMAQMLLDEAGVSSRNGATLVNLDNNSAADALAAGQVDAVFCVISPDAAAVRKFTAIPGVRLMSFDNAHADDRRHPFLSATTLYEGSIDISHNYPPTNIDLIAAPATVAVRDSTHEAIIQLLVRAAQEANSGKTLLANAGTFPNLEGTELPVNRDAKYFMKNPPSILHRTLPFWLASMIDRLIILVLPMLVVLIPLIRMTPPLLKWRTNRKLLARYRRCREIEERLTPDSPPEMLRSGINELTSMDRELAMLKIPLSFSQDLYNLRVNVSYVRTRLDRWLHESAAAVA